MFELMRLLASYLGLQSIVQNNYEAVLPCACHVNPFDTVNI